MSDEQATTQPLYSDDEIAKLGQSITINPTAMRSILLAVRNSYEAALASLRQQLETVSRELVSTDNADRYYRGFNAGFDHAQTQPSVAMGHDDVLGPFSIIDATPAVDAPLWEPVPDGKQTVTDAITKERYALNIHHEGKYITQRRSFAENETVFLPNEYRLCRRRTQGGSDDRTQGD